MPDSEPVRLWREKFKLNLSASWKHDVEITVTDLSLWKKILDGWGWRDAKGKWHRKAPGIKGLLDEYERQQMDQVARCDEAEASALSARDRTGFSERYRGGMRSVRDQAPSLYFGSNRVDE